MGIRSQTGARSEEAADRIIAQVLGASWWSMAQTGAGAFQGGPESELLLCRANGRAVCARVERAFRCARGRHQDLLSLATKRKRRNPPNPEIQTEALP